MIGRVSVQIRCLGPLSLAACVLAGCAGLNNDVGPQPKTADVPLELPAELAEVPIIDIHAHTFNARYLPLRHIALGKRDANPLLQFFPDPVAEAVAIYIAERTPLSSIGGEGAMIAAADQRSDDELMRDAAAACGVKYEKLANDPAVLALQRILPIIVEQSSALKAQGEGESTVPEVNARPEEIMMTRKEERALRRKMEALGFELTDTSLANFLRALTCSDDASTDLYRELFGEPVELIVSHYLDLGPTYGQTPDSLFLDFGTEQLRRASYFQRQADSGMIFFAGYNPYRDHWPSREDGKGLDIIKNAVMDPSIAAYGVKFYPPSGYRPIENDIPSRPCALFSRRPGQQWDARYEGITNGDLDNRIGTFLQWCETNDVPVFAHCNTGEFEARKGYGLKMSNPKWWKAYLEHCSQNNHGGAPCNLRLAFGHAGGSDFWFDRGKHQDWGETVVELCETYPNVYCEIGIFGEIAKEKSRLRFVNVVSDLFSHSNGTYSISDKVMYGTDYFMPSGSPAKDYLHGFQRAFLDPRLRCHYVDFFLGNALKYLDARKRVAGATPMPPPPDSSRAILERLLRTMDELTNMGAGEKVNSRGDAHVNPNVGPPSQFSGIIR